MKNLTKLIEKEQQREHLIRVQRERRACGRITLSQYHEEVRKIEARFDFTEVERRALSQMRRREKE